ncbi:MAG: glycosyltransferase [Abyssibacter sp.]|nr:glycosyltransferase [Abyssibacter sp.]MCK5857886.1 glycosyltransferase [Abyssibacter sp.]
MHVLSVIHYPVFGGPHNRSLRLAPVLAKKGVRTTVLLPDEPGNAAERLRDAGVDVVQLPLRRVRATRGIRTHLQFFGSFPRQIRDIRRLIERLGIDLVQLNGLANPHGAIAGGGMGIPVVWQILDTYTPIALRKALKPLVRRYADVVMCTGVRVAQEHPGMPRKSERLVNFYPPVDTALFRPDPGLKASVREKLGLSDASLVVGTVGNINLQKGHHNFIRAAALLKGQVPGVKFLLLGAMHSNHREYIDGLWRLAAGLGLELERDLIALDPTGRVHELVQAMDIFWMTPRRNSEGIPTAMEEAMALGLPVVSFDVGSIAELVQHGHTGYVVNSQGPEEIATCTLEHLLEPAQRTELGRRGRQFIEENASLEACAERHVRAYEMALGTRIVPDLSPTEPVS